MSANATLDAPASLALEIMSVSGHQTLKEVERYTKAANRPRLASSAIAALQLAQKEGA